MRLLLVLLQGGVPYVDDCPFFISPGKTMTTCISPLNRFQRQTSTRPMVAESHADLHRRLQVDDSSDSPSPDGDDSIDDPDNNGATPTPTPVAGGGGGVDESSDDGTPSPIDSADDAGDDVGDDTLDSPDLDTLDSPGDDGYGGDQEGDSEVGKRKAQRENDFSAHA